MKPRANLPSGCLCHCVSGLEPGEPTGITVRAGRPCGTGFAESSVSCAIDDVPGWFSSCV
eukprot:2505853-Pleurochrysis_carterae.AAC.1